MMVFIKFPSGLDCLMNKVNKIQNIGVKTEL